MKESAKNMDFEAICDLARRRRRDFCRVVENEIYKLDDGCVLALARMRDTFHDMEIAILLSDSLHVKEIGGRIDRIPYPCCETKPLEMLSLLKGIGVMAPGAMKQVRERIPRNQGCTHLYEMIEAAFRAVFAGANTILYGEWERLVDISPDEHRQLGMHSPLLSESCHAFNAEGADKETLKSAIDKFHEAQARREAIKAMRQDRGEA